MIPSSLWIRRAAGAISIVLNAITEPWERDSWAQVRGDCNRDNRDLDEQTRAPFWRSCRIAGDAALLVQPGYLGWQMPVREWTRTTSAGQRKSPSRCWTSTGGVTVQEGFAATSAGWSRQRRRSTCGGEWRNVSSGFFFFSSVNYPADSNWPIYLAVVIPVNY